jgi:uncharacterized protein YciI
MFNHQNYFQMVHLFSIRYIGLITILFLSVKANCQTELLPTFLKGTWKVKGIEQYEHWDVLNNQSMKGFGYSMKQEHMQVNEYLKISTVKKDVIYTANAISQNNGTGIAFKLILKDSTFCFVNPKHDYPKEISYKPLNEKSIFVQVSGGEDVPYSYILEKIEHKKISIDSAISNPNYDQQLAIKLGGDDYGMKYYYFVILKTGANTTTDKDFINECFKGHMENMGRMVESGNLVVAGPFGKNDDTFRGLFILNNLSSMEEAKTLLDTDPAIKNGLLEAVVYKWYGSAALPEYLPFSDKIWRMKPF